MVSDWELGVLPGAWPIVEDMVRHFDNYEDLLEGVRRSGRLATFDLQLDASEDSFQDFSRRVHRGPSGLG